MKTQAEGADSILRPISTLSDALKVIDAARARDPAP